MRLLDATNATAAYGQVGLWDGETYEYPQLRREIVAANERAIAVAVPAGPTEPPTRLEFWTHPAPTESGLRSICTGIITIGGRGARAGGWMRGDASAIDLPSGTHHVEVFTSTGVGSPPLVRFVLRLQPTS